MYYRYTIEWADGTKFTDVKARSIADAVSGYVDDDERTGARIVSVTKTGPWEPPVNVYAELEQAIGYTPALVAREAIRDLARMGNKINAIKFLRKLLTPVEGGQSKLSLKVAKDYVDDLV